MEDYKVRFIKECEELRCRITKLKNMLTKHANGTLDFEPSCPYDLLYDQYLAMMLYYDILKQRAVIEGINIGE